ncbi:hypothetical protein NQ318_014381 [Aromia moschata]|uniref:Uncharacterized protein n=1 Tax=Aromia moschata TaxID=1265417 RepID=A0AAV8X1A7_9CUCU|nr:hypothetical protein NQ318_014381 [Aromia moschata]
MGYNLNSSQIVKKLERLKKNIENSLQTIEDFLNNIEQRKVAPWKKINYNTQKLKKNVHQHKPKDVGDAISVALRTIGKNKKENKTCSCDTGSKKGGILPLIPIFAGLSAPGGPKWWDGRDNKSNIRNKNAKEQLEESQRHNKRMESIAMGKGLYMRPYKTGLGLF